MIKKGIRWFLRDWGKEYKEERWERKKGKEVVVRF